MPYASQAQEKFFNANRDKLEKQGVDVDEWNKSSKGKKLPKRIKTVKGGNTDLSPNSMKGQALVNDRKENLALKNQFKTRKSGMKVKI